MWYQRLYKGMISDGAVSFATFFCVFMIHIAFCIWSALAPELGNVRGTGHAGLLPAIDFLKGSGTDKVVGASVVSAASGAAVWRMYTHCIRGVGVHHVSSAACTSLRGRLCSSPT